MRPNRAFVAAILVFGGTALAASLTHTLTTDFDGAAGTSVNVSTAGDQLQLQSVSHAEPDGSATWTWFRSPYDFDSTDWQLEIEKDDGTVFGLADTCLDATASTLSDLARVTVNGRDYRAGPFVIGANEASAGGGSLTLDFASGTLGRLAGVLEVRILTSGTHGAVASSDYTVTFDHETSADLPVAAPIAHDTVSVRDAGVLGLYDVTDAGLALAPANGCGNGYIDEVRFFNDLPGEATSMILSWQHDDGIAPSWLNGPLAVTVVVDQATWDALFDVTGTYETIALDAGANALWYEVATDSTLNGGAARVSVSCSADGVLFEDPATYGSPFDLAGGAQQFALIDPISLSPSQACAGRYASYTVELANGFDDPVGPLVHLVTLAHEPDADADGFDPGGVLTATDCDDTDAAIHPAAAEVPGNGVDEDCDGVVACFQDLDGDGFGSAVVISDLDADDACTSAGESAVANDCDDAGVDAALRYPGFPVGQPEIDDGIDNDCDGGAHDECWLDADSDGRGVNTVVQDLGDDGCQAAQDEATLAGDCAPANADAFPGNPLVDAHVNDSVDNDCVGGDECFADGDDDGFGVTGVYTADVGAPGCTTLAGDAILEATQVGDCAPANGDAFPGNSLVDAHVDDDVDNDCAGGDECFADADDDGVGVSGSYVHESGGNGCTDAAGDGALESSLVGDCLPSNPEAFPGNVLVDAYVDDGADNDCLGGDECFADPDDDGFGVTGVYTQDGGNGCSTLAADGVFESTQIGDCLPGNNDAFPGNVLTDLHVNDAIDNDCAGGDECFADSDDDGFGIAGAYVDDLGALGCDDAAGDGLFESTLTTDCVPGNADAFPGNPITGAHVNNGVDNDCAGGDECFSDADDDGFGVAGLYVDDLGAVGCEDTAGDGLDESTLTTDCAPSDADAFPGNPIVDGHVDNVVDNDCSGGDECFADADDDGYGVAGVYVNDLGAVGCTNTAGDGLFESTLTTDCVPGNAAAYPGNPTVDAHVNNNVDNNCSGTDECFADTDDDGFGVAGVYVEETGANGCTNVANDGVGESSLATDCAPTRADAFPGNTLTGAHVNNAVDNDCVGGDECFADADDDGFGVADSFVNDLGAVGCANTAGDGLFESTLTTDCAAADADAFPGNPIVDGHVNNNVDNDCAGGDECFADTDDDGFGFAGVYVNETGANGCNNTAGNGVFESSLGTDCAPANASAFPGNPIVDAHVDNDVDNDCANGDECFADTDDDGFGVAGSHVDEVGGNGCTNLADDGVIESSLVTDCHPTNPDAFPGNPIVDAHVADPHDNDCSGGLGFLQQECFADTDDDGWGVPNAFVNESAGDPDAVCSNAVANGVFESDRITDCDPVRPNVNPSAPDVCGDGLDNDCDNAGDWAVGGVNGWLDDDGDGVLYDDEVAAGTSDCDEDTDGDGLTDDDELLNTLTDPLVIDTDGDQLGDGFEVGPDPLNPIDSDSDGTHDALDPDDDGDGVDTFDEDVDGSGTPTDDDTDGDFVADYLDEDDDDDGLPTLAEIYGGNTDPLAEDTDADGTPDFRDDDDDDDAIPTSEELLDDPTDLDLDGLPGYRDDDSDGDGWSDAHEHATSPDLFGDTDGDGDRDHVDFDADDDLVLDDDELGTEVGALSLRDTDGDGLEDRIDPDDDGDAVPTAAERYGAVVDPMLQDTDTDGTADYLDADDDDDGVPTGEEVYGAVVDPRLQNSDADGLPDYRDTDDDGDTVSTVDEDLDGNGDPRDDHSDADGLPNYRDTDDDGDGVLTADESPDGDNDPLTDDSDNDGTADWLDTDDDQDGIPTASELLAAADPDGDGIPNHLDTDSDGDGWSDLHENLTAIGPLDDTDVDGLRDAYDPDSDNDNVADADEAGNEALPVDTDLDGRPDRLDADDDGDLVATIDESPDTDGDPLNDDTDSDGVPDFLDDDDDGDRVSTSDEDPDGDLDPRSDDTDSDGLADYLDTDDDGDRVDTIDEDPNGDLDPMSDDTDNDGTADYLDTDDDGDRVPTIDEDPNADLDPMSDDTDNDGTADYLDTDDDGDRVATIDEDPNADLDPMSDDTDNDGTADYLDTDDDGDRVPTIDEDPDADLDPMSDDTDNDGTPNYLDTDDDGDTVATIDETWDANLDPMDDDTDQDGTPNFLDDDDDDDTVLTREESPDGNGDPLDDDTDGDGLLDHLDDDDDGDGLETALEDPDGSGSVDDDDTDGDLVPNYLDADDDGDGVRTLDEDLNGDGDPRNDGAPIPHFLDPDDDADGVDTIDEDPNGNGDRLDDDTDGDGFADWLDPDDDGDGLLSLLEDPNGDGDPLTDDTDGDGVPNFQDDDDDGDLVPTALEDRNGNGDVRDDHTDTDGIPDYLDDDDDGDSVRTADEDADSDGDPTNDATDADGVPDYLDTDDDDDRVPTIDESPDGDADPLDDDTDGDGTPDFRDTDDDGDGVDTILEDPDADLDPQSDDTDSDGTPDYLDTDDDGDRVATIDEDPDGDGDRLGDDTDGDGLPDFQDDDDDGDNVRTTDEVVAPNVDPLLEDTDGDGIADFLDEDDDGDNVPTGLEVLAPNADPLLEDTDSDGTPDFLDDDDDNDTVPTATEAYGANSDPLAEDTDGDGTPDFRDTDDDADGVETRLEDLVVVDGDPTTDDTDGDGLPNYIDADDDGDSLLSIDEDIDGNGDPSVGIDDWDGDGTDDWLDADDDNDGVDTLWEVMFGVDHHLQDHDGDGLRDGEEWLNWLLTAPTVDCFVADCDDRNGGLTGTSFDDPWDRDGDAIINALDPDDDGDGLQTLFEPSLDNECLGDSDGIPTYLDFDGDGDGIDDVDEGDTDNDGDFIPNYLDCDNTGCFGDTDGDGLFNCRDVELAGGDFTAALDPDVDGDGVIDGDEVGADPGCLVPDTAVPCTPQDTDGDGVIDLLDTDDDGDGFLTIDELAPECPGVVALDPVSLELTCDGVVLFSYANTDEDTGDPWPLFPDDVPDYLDDDDDGDGRPSDVEGSGDVDGDGRVNYLDLDDTDGPAGDPDQDGLSNAEEAALGSDPNSEDSDGDSIPDDAEVDAAGNNQDTDSDGIPDILDDDDDGDGIPTAEEGVSDPDRDGLPDYLDRDRDGDGVDDDAESRTEDADCDGIADIDDADPLDGPCSLPDTGLEGTESITNKGCGCAGSGSAPVGSGLLVAWVAALAVARRRSAGRVVGLTAR